MSRATHLRGALGSVLHFSSHVPSVVFTFAIVAVATYAFTVIAKKSPFSLRHFLSHTLPWAQLRQASTKVDVGIYLISKVTRKITSLAMTLGVTTAVYFVSKAAVSVLHVAPAAPADMLSTLLVAIYLFVLIDLAAFLSHLIQHKIPFLWEYHKVHHSARFLTPLTATRFHPVGDVLDAVFGAVALAVGATLAAIFAGMDLAHLLITYSGVDLFFTLVLLAQLQHSHFPISFGPLERIFMSPLMHQVHHSAKTEHWGKNLGSRLAIWDWIAGSGFQLPKGEKLEFGLGADNDFEDYQQVKGSYILPIQRSYAMLLDSRRARRAAAGAGARPWRQATARPYPQSDELEEGLSLSA